MSTKHWLSNFFFKAHYNIDITKLKRRADEDFLPHAQLYIYCAQADGVLSDTEKDFIRGAFLASGRSEDFVRKVEKMFDKNISLEEAADHAQKLSQSDKRALLAGLFDVCASDSLEATEEQAIRNAAGALGVDHHVIDQFKEIYARKRQLQKDRMDIIGSDWFAD